jgi:serine/threonine protein kinase
MAVVYSAQDIKHSRKVAIKVLRPEFTASIGVDRFLREVEIAAKLTHPHVLSLHDSGKANGNLSRGAARPKSSFRSGASTTGYRMVEAVGSGFTTSR